MTDLSFLSFGLATPQSSDKSATNSKGGNGEAGFAAMLAAQWPADVPAADRTINAGLADENREADFSLLQQANSPKSAPPSFISERLADDAPVGVNDARTNPQP